jgi:NitT/TauT family transport system permease protein
MTVLNERTYLAPLRRGDLLRRWRGSLIAPASFVLLILLWEAAIHVFEVPQFVVPPPGAVLQALAYGLLPIGSGGGEFWFHIGITMLEAGIGFMIGCLCGILLGFVVAHSKTAHTIIYPYMIAFQALPKVAIAPLFIIWFGFGLEAKILMTATITFFPLFVNSIAGYHAVDPDRIDMALICGASRSKIFTKIILPSSMPFIFAGLNMAAVLALLGALVAEYVGARYGLGLLLITYNTNMQIDGMFALLVILAFLGWLFSFIVTLIERRVCFWAQRTKNTAF